jgi:RNA polymerase sigma factor (sigma-70 family)
MATNRLGGILRHLRRAVRPPGETQTDAGLLDLYLRRRDEAAFESLVLRHGPMVFGVCRRVLANDQDAEDAFQATFLVLVRKAASVRKRASLGSWLYGVAHRTALEARRAMARRRAKEAKAVPRVEASAAGGDDLREVLDRELAALPERYRAAVVLCDLEGKDRQEAARELGCPEGTVASRLARGRSLLAKRLARRGLATVAAALPREAASACVPAALVSSTVKAAAGSGAAGVVSLTKGVMRAMLLTKLKRGVAVLLLVGLAGLACGVLAGGQFDRQAAPPDQPPEGAGPQEKAAKDGEEPAVYVKVEVKGKLVRKDGGYAVQSGDGIFPGVDLLVRLQRSEDKDRELDEHLKSLEGKAVVVTGFLDCRRIDGEKRVIALHLSKQGQVKAAGSK